MDITVKYVEEKFDEFNRTIFGGKLPRIPVKLSNAKTFLGKCEFHKRRRADGTVERYGFVLRINTRIDLSEQEVEDTIIHEMIHYYIGVNQVEDSSAHGRLFKSIMDTINAKFGRHISITHRGTEEQQAQAVDPRQHYHVIAVVYFHDGRTAIKVLPRVQPSILKFYNGVLTSSEVREVKLYMSKDVFFNRYPNSSSYRVHMLPLAEIEQHLQDAEHMPCDGRTITRTR